jgi:hypothetical protein
MSQESILRPSECEKTPSAATNGDADGVDTGPPELAPAIVTSVTVDRNIRSGPALLAAGVKERFWGRVETEDPGGCWLWVGTKTRGGYGMLRGPDRGMVLAHRVSWEIRNGRIPPAIDGKRACVLHRCDNPPCVNPAHLFLGTDADNNADMAAKGRRRAPRGEANGRARLRASDVAAIREAYAAGGETCQSLAVRHGVAATTISALLSGKTWRKRVPACPLYPWMPYREDG